MDVFTMVVIIVVVSCGAGVVNNYLKTRRLELKQAPSADLDAEVESLKQRVAVLEEIVTDDRYHLNRELDQLERRA
jgi:cell division protein FtsB